MHARLPQKSLLSPTWYSVPSGQVHVPPHPPTPSTLVSLTFALQPGDGEGEGEGDGEGEGEGEGDGSAPGNSVSLAMNAWPFSRFASLVPRRILNVPP